jgi:hypothetical protein
VKKKFDAKIKNRDENIMEFIKGEQILSYQPSTYHPIKHPQILDLTN